MTAEAWIVACAAAAVFAAAGFFAGARRAGRSDRSGEAEEAALANRTNEKASRIEHGRLLDALASLTDGLMAIDREGRVTVSNPAAASAFGLERSRVEGRYFWEAIRDAELNDWIRRALQARESLEREHSPSLSGKVFQVRVSPVYAGDEFTGVAVLLHETTKLKELERMRSEFIANVSHELKTPLTSILGFVETLKEGADDNPEDRRRFLSIIDDHAQKLRHLIDELLLLSRVESGGQPLAYEDVDFGELARETGAYFERGLAERGLRLKIESVGGLTLRADRKLLERALCNLLDNAVKYGAGEIVVRATKETGGAAIEVRDGGPGIPETDLPRVFERFYRVDKSRDRKSGGAGLGLAIVKHIVERHGGRVEARNAAPRGASFLVFLPQA